MLEPRLDRHNNKMYHAFVYLYFSVHMA